LLSVEEFQLYVSAHYKQLCQEMSRLIGRKGFVDPESLKDVMSDRLLDLSEKLSNGKVSFDSMELALHYWKKAVSNRYKAVWDKGNQVYSEAVLDDYDDGNPTPFDLLVQQEEEDRVENLHAFISDWVFGNYPLLHAAAFWAAVKYGYTYQEIADKLGWKRYVVGNVVREIRAGLKAHIAEQGIAFGVL
jgi:hypothetical protein